MSTSAVAANRKALQQAVKTEQARIRNLELARIRSEIQEIKNRRRQLLERVSGYCSSTRTTAKELAKKKRAEVRARIEQEVRELMQAARNRCQAKRHAVRSSSARAIEKKRAEIAAMARHQRDVQKAERKRSRELERHRRAEARGEDDDEVRANIPAELLPVFERVKRAIRGKPGASRTEVFTHWVEEHPDEVWHLLEQHSQTRLAALQREEARAMREAAKAHRAAYGTARTRRAALPAAPF